MNEPSVFDSEEITIPRQSYHTTTTDLSSPFRKKILHRDVHNAYGLFETKATWNALLERNRAFQAQNNANWESEEELSLRRPFLLTRSFFIGSNKFGAFWTGDNSTKLTEQRKNLNMILQAGISGHGYSGFDIPGFDGNPSDE